MIVSDLITMVKDYNGELGVAQDDRIVRWINQERNLLEASVGLRGQAEHSLQAGTLDLVSGEELVPLPADFVGLKSDGIQRLASDGVTYKVATKKDRSDFRQWESAGVTLSDDRFFYAIRGNYLVVRPVPDANQADGIRIDYYRSKAAWDSTSSVPLHWVQFAEILAVGAARRSGIRYEDARAELERHYYTDLVPEFKKGFQRRDQTQARVTTTGRRSLIASRRHRFGRSR